MSEVYSATKQQQRHDYWQDVRIGAMSLKARFLEGLSFTGGTMGDVFLWLSKHGCVQSCGQGR